MTGRAPLVGLISCVRLGFRSQGSCVKKGSFIIKMKLISVDLYDISLEIFNRPKENTFGSGFLITFYIKVVILRIILHIR